MQRSKTGSNFWGNYREKKRKGEKRGRLDERVVQGREQ